jgi:hypothetical protein
MCGYRWPTPLGVDHERGLVEADQLTVEADGVTLVVLGVAELFQINKRRSTPRPPSLFVPAAGQRAQLFRRAGCRHAPLRKEGILISAFNSEGS